ncbi:hypothetical protein K456DRAFT_465516 [Colletotrichum gloeosporioides 23]|nr:hypothetical protein K456DRAFT_465516 [Colletotrichum gloeosporioides 23]
MQPRTVSACGVEAQFAVMSGPINETLPIWGLAATLSRRRVVACRQAQAAYSGVEQAIERSSPIQPQAIGFLLSPASHPARRRAQSEKVVSHPDSADHPASFLSPPMAVLWGRRQGLWSSAGGEAIAIQLVFLRCTDWPYWTFDTAEWLVCHRSGPRLASMEQLGGHTKLSKLAQACAGHRHQELGSGLSKFSVLVEKLLNCRWSS